MRGRRRTTPKWMLASLAALALGGGTGLATTWLRGGAAEPPRHETRLARTPPTAADRAPSEVPDGSPRPGPGASDAPPGAPGAPAPASELDQELRSTEQAIELSRRRSEPPPSPDPRELPPHRTRRAGTGAVPIVAHCSDPGSACRSSAECCPGLACSGGVAGYGTSGTCEAP